MSNINVKTFILALNTLGTNDKKAKSYLKDKRLTQSEKSILQCYFYLSDNQFEKVLTSLHQLNTNDSIVESQKNLFLGVTYNNQGEFLKAIPLFEKALELMQEYFIPFQEFTALNSLFIAHRNLKNHQSMKTALERMHALKIQDVPTQITLMRADFKFASVTADYKEASKTLVKLEKLKKKMTNGQMLSHLVDKFDFYIKTDQLQRCTKLLTEMKSYRKFHLSANYNFMKLLLNHFIDSKPLYVTDSDFIEIPVLFHQIKVILNLDGGNTDEAQIHWKKLAELYPQTYATNFGNYNGDKCLFSICLDKHRNMTSQKRLNEISLPSSKRDALIKLLTEANSPIHQVMIYELIWGEVPVDKNDLNKLARLIYLVKIKNGLDIRTKKSCYYIEKKSSSNKRSKAS